MMLSISSGNVGVSLPTERGQAIGVYPEGKVFMKLYKLSKNMKLKHECELKIIHVSTETIRF